MGGVGSGRHYYWNKRDYIEDYLDIDIRTINQRGWLNYSGSRKITWSRGGEPIGNLDYRIVNDDQFPYEKNEMILTYKSREYGGEWEDIITRIEMTTTDCNFGGKRYWFFCPKCSQRVCILYGGKHFKCRKCHDLVHRSRNESALDQVSGRLQKEKDKVWPELDISAFDSVRYLYKPKWMRQKTYMLKKIELLKLEHKANCLMIDRFGNDPLLDEL